jgi:hypothetical protein
MQKRLAITHDSDSVNAEILYLPHKTSKNGFTHHALRPKPQRTGAIRTLEIAVICKLDGDSCRALHIGQQESEMLAKHVGEADAKEGTLEESKVVVVTA